MRSKLAVSLCIAVALLLVSGLSWFWLAPQWRAHQLIRQSEPIQASLEVYRQQHGRYPASLSEVGIVEREEGPLYYRRESESVYILWFGTTLGESQTFHSTDRRWQ